MVGSIFASCSSLLLLAASSRGDPSDVIKYVLLWSGGLVVVIVLGMWAAAHLKRRYQQQQSDHPTSAAGFTLSDLRELHRTGQMTDEEFERAKAKVIEAARRASERDAKGLSGRPAGPAGFPVVEAKPPPGGVGELGDEGDDEGDHDDDDSSSDRR